jgi:phytoene dehydrogenase-like protein
MEKMEKSIIIIGAGIAGLSAGCYGQMNGYRTQIFELHDKPGGLCTSWKRKKYTIDGCLHWLVGSGPSNSFYRIWQELGALPGPHIIDHDEFITIEGEKGKAFVVYTNVDKLEQHMKELAPQDGKVIEKFTNAVRDCAKVDMPIDKAPELYGPLDGPKALAKMLPFLKIMNTWKKISIQDFAQEFTDPFLRQVFPLTFNLPDFPMMAVLMTLAWMQQKSAGYPEGGSLEFSRTIERRYLNLGGKIHYHSPVNKILVKDGKAVGVRLADGTEHRGDIVISAADGHATIFQMLEGKYIDKKVQEYYEQLPLFPPLIQVSLGVARSFEGQPRLLLYHLKQPVVIAGKEEKLLGVEIYNFDSTLAPPGKTVLDVKLFSDYEYWKSLKQNPKLYKAEKKKIANQVIDLLDQRFPGLAGQVEMCDVATPMTWERYTGNWQASFEGWLITTRNFGLSMSKTLPGLENFYMCGQWVEPGGGVPSAALSARNLIQVICKNDKKSFVVNVPPAS